MEDRILILDGAMGTRLQAAGLRPGENPEAFGIAHPEVVEAIHRSYIDAGSAVIYTNTFGANRRKLARAGVTVSAAVTAAVSAAKKAAAGRNVRVALDIGPIGQLLEPLGALRFEEAVDIYREIAVAGERAGADLAVIETFTDLNDARAALLAVKENTALAAWCTMSFEATGRTFTGTTAASAALTLTALGADAVGVNCSLGPAELLPVVREMMRWTDKPVIVKPNAGLPDPATGEYGLGAAEFAAEMREYAALGIFAAGGCCGTSPDYIRALAPMASETRAERRAATMRGVCAAGQVAAFGGVRVVGERLNPTGKKRFQQALREHDMDYIMACAIEQADAGAEILDINVGLPGLDEPSLMADVVRAVQSVVSLPLQIDSSDPAALEAGLRACCGRAIVNSVNGDERVLESVLPVVRRYGAAVIGLTMDENGIPKTAQARVAIARRILDACLRHGIDRRDVIIDCLTLTVSAQQEQAAETLRAVRLVREELGLRCALGVSNISFGLPARECVTESFLTQAMCCGLEFPIVNPNQSRIMDAVAAYRALSGGDTDCAEYIARFASVSRERPAAAPGREMTLSEAVRRGLRAEAAALTEQMLQSRDELAVINEALIPALDSVGDDYEKQAIFLPQLINSASAAGAAFELIKRRIAKRGAAQVTRGRIIVATVRGDIHDIGKNIVKVILESYGYQVIDLGRDVPPEDVVRAAVEQDVRLVGLSALMTTTVGAMAETIRALRESGHDCAVMVGGAVLTADYAAEIGADYYARDAKQSAEIARRVLG